jgi:hypothetical protein
MVVRINGERKWVKRRGRPRRPLRPSRYKPRRREAYAGEAAADNSLLTNGSRKGQ